MKRFIFFGVAVLALAFGALAFEHGGPTGAPSVEAGKGNGTPTGKHFTLNLIANSDKNANMNNAGGSVIFVPLQCQQKGPNNSPDPSTCNETDGVALDADCRINLTMGDFQVLDKNCTDGVAAYQLPDPCSLDNTFDDPNVTECTTTTYSVWMSLAGKPGGGMDMETCFHDIASNTDICSLETVIGFRNAGKPNWQDVSKCLLTVYANIDADQTIERTFLFSPIGSAWWWEYDNWGNRIAKIRFYPNTPGLITNPGAECII